MKIVHNASMKQKHIAILDFGSQYMHLISRRVRQLGVLAKIYPTDVNAHDLKDAWGIILSGGPQSVNDQSLPYDPGIFDLDIPILGLCYGHQLMASHYDGVVTPAHNREYGKADITVLNGDTILDRLEDTEQVWMSHWDSVTEVPEGFEIIAKTYDCPVAAMANVEKKRYGLQFHPEVHHSTNGTKVIENFVFEICEAESNWSMKEYLEQLKAEIREHVGDKNVFLFVSGGVDSSVAFALLEEILGKERVFGLHVDNGFMRLHESDRVGKALAAAGFDDLKVIDSSDRFILAVENLIDPEDKRRKIGQIFLDAQKDVFRDLEFNPENWLLGQGTIYPDTIESGGTKASDTIKTHHNRIPEIVEMINAGHVIEPLAELYKDEVREIGRELGLPAELIERWPFPGPGLGIRVLCSDGEESFSERQKIEAVLQDMCEPYGVEAAMMPVKSVGVQGDQRSYQHPAMVYGAHTLTWEEYNELSTNITNSVNGINRVVLHVAGEFEPMDMQLKAANMTRERLDLLREAEEIMTKVVQKYGIYNDIWQFPVILIPVSFGSGESIVLRPIESQEAMTVNFYPMAADVLTEMAEEIATLEGVDAVFYDITNKPPATIEWE